MSSFSLMFVANVLLGLSGNSTYAQAYQASQSTGKPILVLVGAEWCPACRVMKHHTLPKIVSDGKLQHVEFAVIDTDQQPSFSKKVMRGELIPQLVLYEKTAKGWRRTQLTGAQSEQQIEELIGPATTRYLAKIQTQKSVRQVAQKQ